jgi:2-polyprenyl-6-methoxyphenol hydroxylase-like FAD-dependent oxidoreductase
VHFAIVGAGPAGASLAYLLARAGAEVTLLERQTDFAREFRGEVLMPSGLDAIRQMGLGDALAALPQRVAERVSLFRYGKRLLDLPLGDERPHAVSQPALLEMLVARAAAFPGFRLERGFTVRDLLTRDGVVVGVRGDAASGPSEVLADGVIGADGRASIVRKRSSLDRARSLQSFDVVWCKVPLPPGFASEARLYIGDGHFAVIIPSPDEKLQVGWVIEKGSFGELRRRGVEEWIGDLCETVDRELAAHLAKHRHDLSHPFLLDVVCDQLDEWTAPGLLLLGDACHAMSPVGGQGLNIALRDALVAANHLAPLARRHADPAALRDASRAIRDERMPEVRFIQRLQGVPPRFLFQRSAFSRFTVQHLLPWLARTGVLPLLFGAGARRMLHGVTDVRLRVAG